MNTKKIVTSTTEPSKDVLWLNPEDNSLKIYSGGWISIGNSGLKFLYAYIFDNITNQRMTLEEVKSLIPELDFGTLSPGIIYIQNKPELIVITPRNAFSKSLSITQDYADPNYYYVTAKVDSTDNQLLLADENNNIKATVLEGSTILCRTKKGGSDIESIDIVVSRHDSFNSIGLYGPVKIVYLNKTKVPQINLYEDSFTYWKGGTKPEFTRGGVITIYTITNGNYNEMIEFESWV